MGGNIQEYIRSINDLYVPNNDVHKYSTRQKHLLYVNKSNH